MKYRDLKIQTQREAPNNARTEGFSLLVRAGYLTRENTPTQLGEIALAHLKKQGEKVLDLLPVIGNASESFFSIPTGNIDLAHCPSCKYTERAGLARFAKPSQTSQQSQLPLEKIETPHCNTIEALAEFLKIPSSQTAKALMYTRVNDGKFIFVVIRGDLQLSEEKLTSQVGENRLATTEEIVSAGAVPGYASAIGLRDEALIVVDDMIPASTNLVAGANQEGFHYRNTNYGRDFTAAVVADLVRVNNGDACSNCGNPLSIHRAISLNDEPLNILLALAETYHDEKGLTLPYRASPFDVFLMHVPGKELDTHGKALEIYDQLMNAGIHVLYDDRDDRAGVKFNDADLLGCPIRVTVGEKALKTGMVELKHRADREIQLIPVDAIVESIENYLIS